MNSSSKARVVVVDDDEGLRETLIYSFEMENFQVSGACDGLKALDIIRSGKFDAVVSDIRMPQMNGVQLLQEIQKMDAQLRPAVILMTGFSEFNSSEVLNSGAAAFFTKPFNVDMLIEKVKSLIRVN